MIAGTSKVTRKGQITLPPHLRKKLHIAEGDVVAFGEQDGRIVVLLTEDVVSRTAGIFKDYMGNGPDFDRDEVWIGIARERGTLD